MSRLSTLIHRLSEVAITAPPERRRQLIRQAAALRSDFKRQQKRFVAFMQLSKRYADRFVLDVSEEIQQQTSFLDAVEKRLEKAKSLREQAVHLRKSYEDEILKSIKKVRFTGAYLSYVVVMLCEEICFQLHPNLFRKMCTYSQRWTPS